MIGLTAAWGAVTGASPLKLIAAGAAVAAVVGLWLYVDGLRDDNATLGRRVGTLETQRAYLADVANGNAAAVAESERRAAVARASAETLRAETNRIAGDLARALEMTDHDQPAAKCTLADRAPDALVDALRVAAGFGAGADGVR